MDAYKREALDILIAAGLFQLAKSLRELFDGNVDKPSCLLFLKGAHAMAVDVGTLADFDAILRAYNRIQWEIK